LISLFTVHFSLLSAHLCYRPLKASATLGAFQLAVIKAAAAIVLDKSPVWYSKPDKALNLTSICQYSPGRAGGGRAKNCWDSLAEETKRKT
jgi:hypothetical protein